MSTGLRLNPADRENGLALLGGTSGVVCLGRATTREPSLLSPPKREKETKTKSTQKVTCFRGCYVRFPGDMCFFDVFSNEIFFGPGFRLFCGKFVGSTVDLVTSKKRKVVR